MANYFDVANAPEGEPEIIVVGDFIQWKRTDFLTDYPPASYSAEYVARITGGGASEIKLAATEYADKYLFTVSSETSASFVAGVYHWQLEITQTATGNRIVIDRGAFEAIIDLDDNQADPRGHAEIMLAKIETILEGKADADVSSYSINGRSLSKLSPQELMEWRDYYRREVNAHNRKEKLRRGKRTNSTILMRF